MEQRNGPDTATTRRPVGGGLHIVVCVKAVPKPEEVKVNLETRTLDRGSARTEINPPDLNALELAFSLRDRYGGRVSLLSMGPPLFIPYLRVGLAMGADAAYLLSDRAFGGADTLATSCTLAKGIERIGYETGGYDLVVCGEESSDGATAQVPPGIAEWLGVPQATYVTDVALDEAAGGRGPGAGDGGDAGTRRRGDTATRGHGDAGTPGSGGAGTSLSASPRLRVSASSVPPAPKALRVHREIKGGHELLRVPLPAVLSAMAGSNAPRFFDPARRPWAAAADVVVWDLAALGVEPRLVGAAGSATQVAGLDQAGRAERRRVIVRGTPEEEARALAAAIREALGN